MNGNHKVQVQKLTISLFPNLLVVENFPIFRQIPSKKKANSGKILQS